MRNRDRVVSRDDLLAAVWNGRIVSEATLASRINAARTAIGDNGGEQRLIRTVLRKGVRFVGIIHEVLNADATIAVIAAAEQPPLTFPDRPSIAVLPFTNMSGDQEQDYFADGMVEEITTALSRLSWLFVIARNSSFTYKGRAVDVKQVGRELGVRYVLEGSVRKSANRLRITGQLIDASTGAHLWADRFDGTLDDIFDLQDQVAASVVRAISPKVEQVEIMRSKRKPTESLDAYDYFLHGMASAHVLTRKAAISEALQSFHKAIEIDPDFASAYGMAAWCYVQRKHNRWMADRSREVFETSRLARKAADLGWDDAVALSRGGHALSYVTGDLEAAELIINRALILNPNLAFAWFAIAWLKMFLGEPEIAMEHFSRVMRLSPIDPLMPSVRAAMSFAHFLIGHYDKASSLADQVLRDRPDLHLGLRVAAASHALAGRTPDAQSAMARLREVDPLLRVSDLKDLTRLKRAQDLAKIEIGLRKAGLPE